MKTKLESYKFPKEVIDIVKPIINILDNNNKSILENEIAKLSLDVCDKIEKKDLSPKQADSYFTLIDLYITDNYPNLKLEQEVKDILFEGMILHDYGKDYGANLETLKSLSKKVLNRK